ncbi:MAG TPA: EamA family transporter [Caldilineaceae bacterium]|nr:EamA family transporter [Caldilineaceae bacterium]
MATLIWASSFVIAKLATTAMGPLTIAALRYLLAGLLMLPFLLIGRQSIRRLPRRLWWRLGVIGLAAHGFGNGALFFALNYLSPTTLTFLSCFLPVFILILGIVQLHEIPSGWQVLGLVLTLFGSALFFSWGISSGELMGLGIALAGLLSFSYSTVLGREIARDRQTSTLALTALPLAFGGLPLLAVALASEGPPPPSLVAWQSVLFLTLFNTILAYWLYNHSMQVLTAFETNIFLNLSPLGTAVLSWYIFNEQLTALQLTGMCVAIVAVTLVQWRRPAELARHQKSADQR